MSEQGSGYITVGELIDLYDRNMAGEIGLSQQEGNELNAGILDALEGVQGGMEAFYRLSKSSGRAEPIRDSDILTLGLVVALVVAPHLMPLLFGSSVAGGAAATVGAAAKSVAGYEVPQGASAFGSGAAGMSLGNFLARNAAYGASWGFPAYAFPFMLSQAYKAYTQTGGAADWTEKGFASFEDYQNWMQSQELESRSLRHEQDLSWELPKGADVVGMEISSIAKVLQNQLGYELEESWAVARQLAAGEIDWGDVQADFGDDYEEEEVYTLSDMVEMAMLADVDTVTEEAGDLLGQVAEEEREWNLDDSYSNTESDGSALPAQFEANECYDPETGSVDSLPKASSEYGGETSMSGRVFRGRDGKWRWANSGKPVNAPRSGGYRRGYRRY